MNPLFRLEVLGEQHDRGSFGCGHAALDRYIKTQATQDARRHVSNCFVAVETASGLLAAYYTLAAASIATPDLPAEVSKRLPRYPTIPAVRVGRLAVDLKFQALGLGSSLLADALQRILVSPAAVFALLVEAKDDGAAAFYRHLGFLSLSSQPGTLFLPVATAAKTWL